MSDNNDYGKFLKFSGNFFLWNIPQKRSKLSLGGKKKFLKFDFSIVVVKI